MATRITWFTTYNFFLRKIQLFLLKYFIIYKSFLVLLLGLQLHTLQTDCVNTSMFAHGQIQCKCAHFVEWSCDTLFSSPNKRPQLQTTKSALLDQGRLYTRYLTANKQNVHQISDSTRVNYSLTRYLVAPGWVSLTRYLIVHGSIIHLSNTHYIQVHIIPIK